MRLRAFCTSLLHHALRIDIEAPANILLAVAASSGRVPMCRLTTTSPSSSAVCRWPLDDYPSFINVELALGRVRATTTPAPIPTPFILAIPPAAAAAALAL